MALPIQSNNNICWTCCNKLDPWMSHPEPTKPKGSTASIVVTNTLSISTIRSVLTAEGDLVKYMAGDFHVVVDWSNF